MFSDKPHHAWPLSSMLAVIPWCNILCLSFFLVCNSPAVASADTTSNPREVIAHEPCQCQSPTRSFVTLQAPDHPCRGGPQVGPAHRQLGLDRNGGPSSADTSLEAEERRGSPSASACFPGGHASDGQQKTHLSGGGGSHPLLRPGALLVRADRDAVDPGLHYHPGLHRVDGRRRDQAYQSAGGAPGGETQAGRPHDTGGRYHSAGGID